jgi:hypothetical protein
MFRGDVELELFTVVWRSEGTVEEPKTILLGVFSKLKTPGSNYKNFHSGTNLDLILTSVICFFVQRIPLIPSSGNNPRVWNPFLGERSTIRKGQEHLIVLKELLLSKEFVPHDPFQKKGRNVMFVLEIFILLEEQKLKTFI